MKDITDEQILEYLERKESFEKGFRLLVEQYQERLYWHIRRLVTEHQDADDIIQDTFVKVYRNLGRFKKKSKLYTWMYRIATNEALTFLKKKQRRMTYPIDDANLALSNRLKADQYFESDTIRIKLQQAIQLLPEKQKLVFNMRYFDEMPYRDISEVLSTSEGALKASYHHAVRKIERFLRNEKGV